MFHGFQLHFVSESPFAWQDGFTLKIAVHHEQNCGIIIHVADNDRQGVQSGKLGCVLTTVPGNTEVGEQLARLTIEVVVAHSINGSSTHGLRHLSYT